MNKNDLSSIQFKLQKAHSLLVESEAQVQNGFYNTTVNRIYYACFHATMALLLSKNVTPKTHNGVVHQLYENFVSKGSFDKSHSAFYSKIMQQRMDSDYSVFLVFTKEEAEELIQPAKEYIDYITSLISSPGTQDNANNPAP